MKLKNKTKWQHFCQLLKKLFLKSWKTQDAEPVYEKAEDASNISHAIEDYEDQQKASLLAIIRFNPELGRHRTKSYNVQTYWQWNAEDI